MQSAKVEETRSDATIAEQEISLLWQQAKHFCNLDSPAQAIKTLTQVIDLAEKIVNERRQIQAMTEIAIQKANLRELETDVDSLVVKIDSVILGIQDPKTKRWAQASKKFVEGLKWYGGSEFQIDSSLKRLHELEQYCESNTWVHGRSLQARIYYFLGDIYFYGLENKRMGGRYLEKSLLLSMKESPNLELTRSLLFYGWAKVEEGEYDYALQILYHALGIRQHFLGNGHAKVANTWNQIGKNYYQQADYSRAKLAYQQAYETIKSLNRYPVYEFYYLNNLSASLERGGEFGLAEQYYQQAEELVKIQAENQTPGFHQQAILCYQNQAALYINQKQFHKAAFALGRADQITRQYEAPEFLDPALTQFLWAEYYLMTNQVEPAVRAIESARHLYGITQDNHRLQIPTGSELQGIIDLLMLDAEIYRAAHKPTQATLQTNLNTYLSLFEYAGKERFSYHLEADQLQIVSRLHQALKEAITIGKQLVTRAPTPKHLDQFFQLIEQGKSPVLQQLIAKGQLLQKDARQQKPFMSVRNTQTIQLTTERPQHKQLTQDSKQLYGLIREVHRQSSVIQQDSFTFPVIHPHLSTKELQSKILHPDELLIEYAFVDSLIYELSFTSERHLLRTIPLTPALSAQILQFRAIIRDREAPQRMTCIQELGFDLYQCFIQPVIDHHIRSGRLPERITFVPEGEFLEFPFELLLSRQTDATNYKHFPFLFRQMPVNHAFSSHLREGQSALQFEDTGQIRLLSLNTFEQGAISKLTSFPEFIQPDLLHGEQATKSNWLAAAPKYQLLQIISHGFANTTGGFPYLLMNKELNGQEKLSIDEVGMISLSADLAVLTACEGGLGPRQRGEGNLSMLRALRMAGCKNLLAGMWEVHMDPLPMMLEHFYEGLALGLDIPQALRKTKLIYLKQASKRLADPFYWGALVSYSY